MNPAQRAGRLVDVALLAGLALVVGGTFLPWLRSGTVDRNSYESVGLLRRLHRIHGVADTLASAWPFVSLACAAAAAGVVFGLRRTAGTLAALAAVVAAVAAGYALSRSSAYVTIRLLGPVVSIAGAVLTAAAVTIFFSINRTRRAP